MTSDEPNPLRVALFTDAFHELNGVGTVSREYAAFAQRRGLPFCRVNGGPVTCVAPEGSVTSIELKRSLRIRLDKDLYCDPLLIRYRNRVMRQLAGFRPDVIHITSPGDMGILGAWISRLMNVPLAASWHTNLHEYVARRIRKTLGSDWAAGQAERLCFRALLAFYRLADFVLAPNQSMVDLLAERTARPSFLMKHGVDTARFAPRAKQDGPFCIGFVGRLTPEKNVRAFVEMERQLLAAGQTDFQLLLVGDGSERNWLRKHLTKATLPGFLEGDKLPAAFASMDAFVFPSKTDTFGLVVLEAMASGVPVLLGPEAGRRIGIRDGVEGFLSTSFSEGILTLMRDRGLRQRMGIASSRFAQTQSWDGVFEDLYRIYGMALNSASVRGRKKFPPP